MPSPILVKQTAIAKFQSYRIQLPPQSSVTPGGLKLVRAPAGTVAAIRPAGVSAGAVRSGISIGSHRAGAGAGAGGSAAPTATPMQLPPALFLSASNSVDDVNLQRSMHDGYTQLIEKLADAVRHAWDMFRAQSFFSGIRIMGPTATGGPGCLAGPTMDQQIRIAPSVAGWTGWWATVRDQFSHGFQNSWQDWQKYVTVPGLPWYPMFTAFPGPMAPPMPNVPTPLLACVSAGVASMAGPALKTNLAQKLDGKMDYHDQFSDAMAVMIAPAFTTWLASQQVMRVMGQGSIPSYAPPYVPVGPVVGGHVLQTPGCLSA